MKESNMLMIFIAAVVLVVVGGVYGSHLATAIGLSLFMALFAVFAVLLAVFVGIPLLILKANSTRRR